MIDLLKAALIVSTNNAAIALGEYIAGDNEKSWDLREIRDYVIGDPVGKAIPLDIASNVLERQDRDGSFLRQGRGRSPPPPSGPFVICGAACRGKRAHGRTLGRLGSRGRSGDLLGFNAQADLVGYWKLESFR